MTHQTRREILDLTEALIEGIASESDYARLEELLLSDSECRTVYLQAIELHGTLHWDAAGIGSQDFEQNLLIATGNLSNSPVPQALPSQKQPTSRTQRIASVIAVLGLLIMVSLFIRGSMNTPTNDNVVVAPEPGEPIGPNIVEVIPELTLPPSINQPTTTVVEVKSTETLDTPHYFDTLDDATVVSFINTNLQNTWEENDLSPAPISSDAEWVRRVHLDLAGRIPTPTETESFLKDRSPDKRSELVDELLASRDFSRHYATTWTNLLVGRSPKAAINRNRLLSYLENQFGNNRSWRETVTDLITAEGSAEESGPANFLLAHLNNEAVPATAITARTLLCQQLQCAQCHKHPEIAQWGQDSFWEFNAFFQQTRVDEQRLVDQETGEKMLLRTLVDENDFGPTYYDTLQGVTQVAYPEYAGQKLEDKTDQPLRQVLAELMTSGDRPQLAKAFINRNWAHFFGYGFTPQVDDMGPHSRISHPLLLDGLSEAFVKSGYDTQRLVKWICLSKAYQLSSEKPDQSDSPELGDPAMFSRMYVKRLTAEQLYDSLLVTAGVTPDEMHRRGQVYADREEWLQQFFTSTDTEENDELSTFDGTVPQALMIINSELVQRAIDPQQGEVFRSIVFDGKATELEKIRRLSLAALSRYPTPEETAAIRSVLRKVVKSQTERNIPPQVAVNEGLRDIYWAYLNSSEFAINH